MAIRGIAAGGAGVGDLPDGRVVFVPRTAPGDRAMIRLDKSRPRWARGTVVKLLEAGPRRVEAPCAHYGECGGCHLQHLPYDDQLEWKARFVVDALERIGKLQDPPRPEIVGSPKRIGYRNRMTFTLRRLRGGHLVAGFHALGRPAHVIDIEDGCLLPRPRIASAWGALRGAWGPGAARLPAGGRLQLTLREASLGVELIVRGGPPGWDPAELVAGAEELVAVWHLPAGESQAARLLLGSEDPLGGPAFAQVNPEAADLLRGHVLSAASSTSAGSAVDAYAGTGEYGRALTEKGWSVSAIEIDPVAVAAARVGAPDGFEVVEGRVEDRLRDALPADLLILNPPRTGLQAEVPVVILERPPERVIYVSCDPGTLARDLGALSTGFDLVGLRCFDLFPQTAHVETVATLQRSEAIS